MTTTSAPDAIVYPDPPFGFRVTPSPVLKHVGEVFTVLNATNRTIHVSFPVLPTTPPEADIPPHTKESFLVGSVNLGLYDYHVTMLPVTRDLVGFDLRATANSDPRILID